MKYTEYNLFSDCQDREIAFFTEFNGEKTKKVIIEWLTENTDDMLIHSKGFCEADSKRFCGDQILNFYSVNPKTGEPSLIITRRNNECFKALS